MRRAPKHVSLQPEERRQDCVNNSLCHPPPEKTWTATLQTIGFANYAELHSRVICDSVSCVSSGYTRIALGSHLRKKMSLFTRIVHTNRWALLPALHETKPVYKIFKNLLIFVFVVFIYCYKYHGL